MRIRYEVNSALGARSNQEDSWLALPNSGLFAVADGMGGYTGGEVASRLAVEAIRNWRGAAYEVTAFFEAHRSILASAPRGAGSTLTVACISPTGHLRVGHVGDSRLYLVRKRAGRRVATQLTTDHANGDGHLTNCLGVRPACLQHVEGSRMGAVALRPDDVILLVTDGLTRYLQEPADILGTVLTAGFGGYAGRLVQHALRAGGADNVTVLAVCCSP